MVLAYLSEQSVVSVCIKLILTIFRNFASEKSTGTPKKLILVTCLIQDK